MSNRIDLSERFAQMWRKSRESMGKSQDFMSKALGVSKKTVQNWEDGTSCPSQIKGLEWFDVLDLNPLPYYLEIFYPDFQIYGQEDEDVDKALSSILMDFPIDVKRKLLFMFSGMHDSSIFAIMEMLNAHLQTPLRDRLNIAQDIALNYEIATASNNLRCADHIQPDMEFLYKMIGKGKEAVLAGKDQYIKLERGD